MKKLFSLMPAVALAATASIFVGCETGNENPGSSVSYAKEFRAVKIMAADSHATQLAVHACAGLNNRRLGGSVFVQPDGDVPQAKIDGTTQNDSIWLEELNLQPSSTVNAKDFLNQCVTDFGGCVKYSYDSQQAILPAILTASAALGAVPVATESPVQCKSPVLDATKVFADKQTQYLSTKYVYENYLSKTSGLAMLNPGYDRYSDDLSNPDLTEDMPPALIDFVFSRKLFVVFLINGCIDGHQEEDLLTSIVDDSGWETPIGVYGYNDSWLQEGYLYEAQTRCLEDGKMGAIPTRTSNLSFFDTRRPPITGADELAMNPPEEVAYDPEKTYVAFVIGDGDNIRYIMSTRRDWLQQRLSVCKGANPKCPPLTWSISPHLPEIAPDVLEWYYEAAESTGADYFILPPSGYQYAYPSLLNDEDEAKFVSETERVAGILGTRSVVHWEWFQSWRDAMEGVIPRYAHEGGQIHGIFPINVPYLFEAFSWWPDSRMNKVLTGDDGGKLAVFRPQSWRGVDGSDGYHLAPTQMTEKLAAFPKGTVTWVYMTSDGGLTLDNSYTELIELLPDHVQIVSTDAAARLAIAAEGN